jgi:hypothetical protein
MAPVICAEEDDKGDAAREGSNQVKLTPSAKEDRGLARVTIQRRILPAELDQLSGDFARTA